MKFLLKTALLAENEAISVWANDAVWQDVVRYENWRPELEALGNAMEFAISMWHQSR